MAPWCAGECPRGCRTNNSGGCIAWESSGPRLCLRGPLAQTLHPVGPPDPSATPPRRDDGWGGTCARDLDSIAKSRTPTFAIAAPRPNRANGVTECSRPKLQSRDPNPGQAPSPPPPQLTRARSMPSGVWAYTENPGERGRFRSSSPGSASTSLLDGAGPLTTRPNTWEEKLYKEICLNKELQYINVRKTQSVVYT